MNELLVRRGDALTARLWNAFWAERRRNKIHPGPGVRLLETGERTVINFDPPNNNWLHPFKASLSGDAVRFRFGVLNETLEPTIGGVPISGDAKHPAPELEIDETKFGADLKSYVGLVVAPDGETGAVKRPPVIEQRATFERFGVFWPLVILYQLPDAPLQRFQHTFFNLRHFSFAAEGGKVRHFFVATP